MICFDKSHCRESNLGFYCGQQKIGSGENQGKSKIGFEIVDVRDLVDLHIRAMTDPEAAGQRYIASSGYMWMKDRINWRSFS
jgi:nucleoside-diphosphate-sugar epimerase